MPYVVIPAERRQELGSNAVKWLRRAGKLPAVVYGKDVENQSVSLTIDARNFDRIYASYSINTLFDLQLDGQEMLVMVKAIQRHPVKRTILHVDFMKVNMSQKQEFQIPLNLSGTPKGVKEGGIMEQVTHAVTVICLPNVIPSGIEVDISELGIGEHITAQELPIPEGVELASDPLTVICTVRAIVERDESAEEGEAPAEPEMIREKKDEEPEA